MLLDPRMKHYYSFALLATLLISGCSDNKKDSPTPDAVVEMQLTNQGLDAADATAVASKQTSVKSDIAVNVTWLEDMNPGTRRVRVENITRGQALFLSINFDRTGRPYVTPAAGKYLEAEVFVNGQSKGKLRLEGARFDDPTRIWRTSATSFGTATDEMRLDL